MEARKVSHGRQTRQRSHGSGEHRGVGHRQRDTLLADLAEHRPRCVAGTRADTGRDCLSVRADERVDYDALQTTLSSKFIYGLWRPVTAIRQADTDLNAATSPDGNWLPLIPTPPYPSYAGNMATIGASAARVIALAIGTDDVEVRATWNRAAVSPT